MQPRDAREVDLLLSFLHERDVRCPRCEYNLRNLTQPVCPECREELALTVGVHQTRFGLLVLTLVPGAFSGIAAVLLLLMMITVTLGSRGGFVPWPIIAADAFGWLSGFVAIMLFLRRKQFLAQARERQIAWAAVTWFIHLAAFVVLIALIS